MARLILTEPGEDVDVGGNVTVIGTTSGGEVITIIRGNVVLDPSFNAGGDTVRLQDLASTFTVRISGANAVLIGATSSVTIPIGSSGLQVAFDDVIRTLRFDTALGVAKLGDQTITISETGVIPVGATGQLLGTEGNDILNGTAGNDVIDGLGGNDTINGLGGDDFIRGGLGDDTLSGGAGDDQIIGGAGNDRIIDDEGTYAVLDGGTGNDHISVNNLAITSLNVTGGEGDDLIELTLGTAGFAIVSGGNGADRVVVSSGQGMEVSVSLGAGRDELVLPAGSLGNGNFGFTIVRDFEVGSNGDKVDLASALNGYLTNYTPGSNPFASGHLRLIDFFGNAYLQVDRDGAAGPNTTFSDLINFAGIDKNALTAANFNGFDPAASIASASVSSLGFAAESEPEPVAVAPTEYIGHFDYSPPQHLGSLIDHGGYFFLV
ncbi:Ca2+-binding RTX toxin-like protein [Sphingomonas kaistensis]|uniref:Ca2+-binding RTX toxin-like protein n=1 Tax=Sphingomonas kaistensis TaxID=298708 RepID=A0A7X6BF41_9SPHN|nr:calcium-binding protein [Sphingomonas kaistensis]NJC04989.1 Ca2+-binding RTX toxin-like protein [Sphingomonas kaistensis]